MLLGSKNITVILSSLQPQQRLLIWHRVVPLDTFQATNRFVVPAPHCRHLVGGPLYSIASAVLGPGPLSPAGHTSHANWVQMRQEWVPDCSPGRCPPLGGRRVVATQKRASCQPPPYTNSVSSGVPLPCGGKVVVAGLAHPFGSGFWHACGAPGLRCLVGPRTILPRSAAGDPPLPNVAQFCRKLCHRGGGHGFRGSGCGHGNQRCIAAHGATAAACGKSQGDLWKCRLSLEVTMAQRKEAWADQTFFLLLQLMSPCASLQSASASVFAPVGGSLPSWLLLLLCVFKTLLAALPACPGPASAYGR